MTKNTTKLKHGEAEELVKEMRAHLRLAQTHSQQGNTGAEVQELREFDVAFDRLIAGIRRILRSYAASCCPSNLVEDLVQEMVIGIFKEVRRLEDTPHCAFYEENFVKALTKCLHNVVKTFRSDKACYNDSFTRAYLKQETEKQEIAQGKRESRSDAQDVEAPLSLNAPVGDDENTGEQIELIRDKENFHAMDNILTVEVRQALYAELSPQDAIFVEALFRSFSVEEAAAKAGIPIRTAFDHRKKICKRICELFGVPMEPGGAVDEAASEFAKPTIKTRAKEKSAPRVH